MQSPWILAGLLALTLSACARREYWTRRTPLEPEVPLETAQEPALEPSLEPMEEPAVEPPTAPPESEVLAQLPRELPAEIAQALDPEAPLFLECEEALAVVVENRRGGVVGRVEDLLLEEATAEVRAVVLRLGSEGAQQVVDYGALDWKGVGSGTARLFGAPPGEEGGTSYAELFDGQATTTIQGSIREIEYLMDGPSRVLVLTVHDQANLFHRVLIEAASLVTPRFPELETEQRIQFEGVLPRNEKGKLWIASALSQGGTSLRLRDAAGRILWRELAGSLQSGRGLLEARIHSADGVALRCTGWRLDARAGVISCLRLEGDGSEHALPWDQVERGADGRWKTALSLSELLPWEP